VSLFSSLSFSVSLSLSLSLSLNDKFRVDVCPPVPTPPPPSIRLWSRRVFRSINFGARRNDVGNATGKRRMQQKRGKMSFVISHSAVRDYRCAREELARRSVVPIVRYGCRRIYYLFHISRIYLSTVLDVFRLATRVAEEVLSVISGERSLVALFGPDGSRAVPNGPERSPRPTRRDFRERCRETRKRASLERQWRSRRSTDTAKLSRLARSETPRARSPRERFTRARACTRAGAMTIL